MPQQSLVCLQTVTGQKINWKTINLNLHLFTKNHKDDSQKET